MNKSEIIERVNALNKGLFNGTNKHLLVLNIAGCYTYNKAIALVDNEITSTNWYEVDYKNCFKTWSEADAFIDGICLARNTEFKYIDNKKGDFENER